MRLISSYATDLAHISYTSYVLYFKNNVAQMDIPLPHTPGHTLLTSGYYTSTHYVNDHHGRLVVSEAPMVGCSETGNEV